MTSQGNYQLAYMVVDEDDRFLLRVVLNEANRQLPAREFCDGQAFIDYMIQNDNDSLNWLVVLDVNMPRLDGRIP